MLTYGTNISRNDIESAIYVNKILRGAGPRDLAVGRQIKFKLVVNLKTARARGIDVPESFLKRADELIRLPFAQQASQVANSL